jgi:hypothetical protein
MSASAQSEYSRRSVVQKSRSARLSFGRGCFLLKTASCCRRAAASKASLWRGTKNARMYVTTANMSEPIAPILSNEFQRCDKLTFNCLIALPKWILMTHRLSQHCSADRVDFRRRDRQFCCSPQPRLSTLLEFPLQWARWPFGLTVPPEHIINYLIGDGEPGLQTVALQCSCAQRFTGMYRPLRLASAPTDRMTSWSPSGRSGTTTFN